MAYPSAMMRMRRFVRCLKIDGGVLLKGRLAARNDAGADK